MSGLSFNDAMHDLRLAAYLAFVADCSLALRRIANHTRKEFSFEEVKDEAWIIAAELADKQHKEITTFFTDAIHRQLLLSHLFMHLVHFRERKIRNAVRLDQAEADGPDKYETILGACDPETSDPLSLLIREAPSKNPDPGDETVASGYVYMLRAVGNSKQALAEALLISGSYFRQCYARALYLAEHQLCLFHGLAHDERQPLRAWRKFQIHADAGQSNSQCLGENNLSLL
jgi:hypothetical protein